MRKKDYQEMGEFEKKYWWHVGRKYFLNKLFKKYSSDFFKIPIILDFGCGMGGNYDFLSRYGKVVGVDSSKTAINYCKKKKQQVRLIDGLNIPFQENSIDLLTTFDVLEHIINDEAVIKEYRRILKDKGKVFITVPAYKFMWSDHDEVLGHCRRYTVGELKNKFEHNGFRTLKASYFVSFLFPFILIYRLFRIVFSRYLDKKTSYVILPKTLNSFFILIMKTESFLLDKVNFPFGCSVVAVFEKK